MRPDLVEGARASTGSAHKSIPDYQSRPAGSAEAMPGRGPWSFHCLDVVDGHWADVFVPASGPTTSWLMRQVCERALSQRVRRGGWRCRRRPYCSQRDVWLTGLGLGRRIRAIRMSPDTELRSSQAGRLSATPTVQAEAERRSTEPLVAETAMSPEPELAWRLAPLRDFTTTSPEPDFAVMGNSSPTDTSPEPELGRRHCRQPEATEMLPDPVPQSRSAALPTVMSPEPLMILERPMSALIEMSADPVLIVGQPVRYPEMQAGLRMPEELVRKADPQPVVIMADLNLLEDQLSSAVVAPQHHVVSRLHDDRSATEVVHDNVPYALVEVGDAHRTHPERSRERRSSRRLGRSPNTPPGPNGPSGPKKPCCPNAHSRRRSHWARAASVDAAAGATPAGPATVGQGIHDCADEPRVGGDSLRGGHLIDARLDRLGEPQCDAGNGSSSGSVVGDSPVPSGLGSASGSSRSVRPPQSGSDDELRSLPIMRSSTEDGAISALMLPAASDSAWIRARRVDDSIAVPRRSATCWVCSSASEDAFDAYADRLDVW